MKKNQNNPSKKVKNIESEASVKSVVDVKKAVVESKPVVETDGRLKFLLKSFLMLGILASVVAFTDKKEYFVGDQKNNHTERKWRSFYRFADKQKKNADIVVFGNSHASAGVEPYIVSMATGTYCFILNTPGSSVSDAYFNLQEILGHKNKPKLVIVETSCLGGGELGEEWGRIQSFEAKKGSFRKLMSLPYLFDTDDWLKALSPTIRNHNFLLTDKERIAFNQKNIGIAKNPDRSNLDLGRFSHGQDFLKDTMLAKYVKNGAPFKAADHSISEYTLSYLKKLSDLCKDNGIELMLFTAPMYHKTFDNYAVKKKNDLESYKDITNLKWLDLQMPYDSTLYTIEAFNNEYNASQHNTYYGMTLNAYNLSKFIIDNYSKILPNRTNEPGWIEDFTYTDFDYVFNQDVAPSMPGYTVAAKNQMVDKFKVKELVVRPNGNEGILIAKIDNHPELKEFINATLEIEIQNQRSLVPITLVTRKDVFPPRHKVYLANLRGDAKVIGIRSIQ
jgi:hypothetical protein